MQHYRNIMPKLKA